jgi:hypothetical protein
MNERCPQARTSGAGHVWTGPAGGTIPARCVHCGAAPEFASLIGDGATREAAGRDLVAQLGRDAFGRCEPAVAWLAPPVVAGSPRRDDRAYHPAFADDPAQRRAHELLHALWTKAAGAPGYDKEQWKALERALYELGGGPRSARREP